MNTINFVTDITTKDTVKTVTVDTIVKNIVTNKNDRNSGRLCDEGWDF